MIDKRITKKRAPALENFDHRVFENEHPKSTVHIWSDIINGVSVRSIPESWLDEMEVCSGVPLNPDQRGRVKAAATAYIRGRLRRTTTLDFETIATRIRRVEADCDKLLADLSACGAQGLDRIIGSEPEFDLAILSSCVEELAKRSHEAQLTLTTEANGGREDHEGISDWDELVHSLADIYAETGARPTCSSDPATGKSSPFLRMIFALNEKFPDNLRTHRTPDLSNLRRVVSEPLSRWSGGK